MSSSKQIEVRVEYHPCGRLTLKERNAGEKIWADVKAEGLYGNTNATSFYQQVAKRLANHAQSNVTVSSYVDTGPTL